MSIYNQRVACGMLCFCSRLLSISDEFDCAILIARNRSFERNGSRIFPGWTEAVNNRSQMKFYVTSKSNHLFPLGNEPLKINESFAKIFTK